MARKTTKELAAARKKKAEERQEAELQAKTEAERSQQRFEALERSQGQWDLLDSVLEGFYDEMDKLAKKAPADEITELGLKRVNELIKQSKELLAGDPFIDSIDPFVAAGENPEHRDILLILREIRQGMKRQREEHQELERESRRWGM